MGQRICSIDDCGMPVQARGWCHKHYQRWRNHGSTDDPKLRPEPRRLCEVEGCSEVHSGRGMCRRHYRKWHAQQQPKSDWYIRSQLPDTPPELIRQRLYAKTRTTDAGCIEWAGAVNKSGYGSLGVKKNGKWVTGKTHRLAWEVEVGPIPAGKFVLHHCDNRRCINIEHLYVGDHDDNMRDMYERGRNGGTGKVNATKAHCPKGHAYDQANTYVTPDGRRECRECTNARGRAYTARKRAKRKAA